MTELRAMLAFLDNLIATYPSLKGDRDFMVRVIRYVESDRNTEEYLYDLVKAFSAFSDSLVAGVNSRRFGFKQTIFRTWSSCAYPRFLSGLTAAIFHEDGKLRSDWCRDSLEALLHLLAFVKRFKHRALNARADAAAKKEFIGYQSRTRPVHTGCARHLRLMWNYFTRDIEQHATIGFPGPGATLDEVHPYCPTFSYLNTWDPDLPDSIRQFYDACFRRHTGFPDARSFLIGPGKQNTALPVFYPLVESPKLRAVCVPKNTKTSRVITVTHVGNTIVGACYRNTIKSLWKEFGIVDQLNVDDQTKSHRNLVKNFDTVSCLDLEGGSSCFTNYLNSIILPDFFKDFLDYSSHNSTFEIDGVSYPVTTQLMGDSISTALLTTSLYLCVVLASYYSTIRPLMDRSFDAYYGSYLISGRPTFVEDYEDYFFKTFYPSRAQFIEHMRLVRDMPVNIVGDDMIFPSFLEKEVRFVLNHIGVTVNDKKSSTHGSLHKESCGCWALSDVSSIRRIYPFRFPEGASRPEQLQSATQYLRRVQNSTFAEELTLTLAEIYGPELLSESYCESDVGSPMGSGLPSRVITRTTNHRVRVDDFTYLYFGLRSNQESRNGLDFIRDLKSVLRGEFVSTNSDLSQEHTVAVRYSRRAEAPRTRIGRFLDRTLWETNAINHAIGKLVRVVLLVYYQHVVSANPALRRLFIPFALKRPGGRKRKVSRR